MKRRMAWLLAVAATAGGAAVVAVAAVRSRTRPLPPPTKATLEGLRAEREALQQKLRETVIAKGERSLAQAPKAGIMIGIPTAFTRSILEQVVTGLFSETTLTLKNLRVHKEGQVRAKMLIAKRTVGDYVLDVQIHHVPGILRPGKPSLAFRTNKVDITLPVRIAEGGGNADLRFKWNSKGLAANVVCGDVDITRSITGGVVPQDYEVRGSFAIAASGEAIVLRPQFPDLAMRIFVDPSEQAWSVVDGIVRDRSKGCEIALNKIDIKETSR